MRNSLAILADRGLVQPGTVIELVPAVRGTLNTAGQENRFQAVVVDPQGGQGSLRWPVDGERYSAQSLLTKLEQEDGVCGIGGVFNNWRIVGHDESITSEARAFGAAADGDTRSEPHEPPTREEKATPSVKEPGASRVRLETIKLVLEIAAIAITVVTGLVALIWRSR